MIDRPEHEMVLVSELPAAAVPDASREFSRFLYQAPDDWLYFAGVSSEQGRRWVEEYRRPDLTAIVRLTVRALPLLHGRELASGHRLLEEAAAALRGLPETRPSVLQVLESIYHPLLAYYQYCTGKFALARQSLDRGEAALTAALESEPFLLTQAFRCLEIEFHRARIARNQRLWNEMHRHVENALSMIHGQRPFCVLPGGAEITLARVQVFVKGLPSIPPEKEAFFRLLNDAPARQRLFDRFVLGIYAMPGFVISYT